MVLALCDYIQSLLHAGQAFHQSATSPFPIRSLLNPWTWNPHIHYSAYVKTPLTASQRWTLGPKSCQNAQWPSTSHFPYSPLVNPRAKHPSCHPQPLFNQPNAETRTKKDTPSQIFILALDHTTRAIAMFLREECFCWKGCKHQPDNCCLDKLLPLTNRILIFVLKASMC